MRVMVMVKATKNSEAGILPGDPRAPEGFDELFEKMGKFNEELVAGYWIWQVKSIEEAVEWVKRCPDPMPGEESEIEIRPIYEAEDFGKEFARGKE